MIMDILGPIWQNILHGKKKRLRKITGKLEFGAMWAKDSNLNSGYSSPHREGGTSLWEFTVVLL